jgi:uncharacterized ubiquitin-like protein YukD
MRALVKRTHINISIDFSNWHGAYYDLRIPIQLTIKQLLLNLAENLDVPLPKRAKFAVKITTKGMLLADDDYLVDFPVTDGDVFVVL